jgi:hypothetical protein
MIFIGKLRTPLKIDKNVQLTVLNSKVKLFNKAGAVNEYRAWPIVLQVSYS